MIRWRSLRKKNNLYFCIFSDLLYRVSMDILKKISYPHWSYVLFFFNRQKLRNLNLIAQNETPKFMSNNSLYVLLCSSVSCEIQCILKLVTYSWQNNWRQTKFWWQIKCDKSEDALYCVFLFERVINLFVFERSIGG